MMSIFKEKASMALASFFMALVFVVLSSAESKAADFPYGKETDGYEVKLESGAELKFRFRLQPRFDFGHVSHDNVDYNTDTDFFLRRTRFETSGKLMSGLDFALSFAADNWDRNNHSSDMELYHAYIDYRLAKFFRVRMGRYKLPMSRIAITSSARQLLIERPTIVEDQKKYFGDFNQTHVGIFGKSDDGSVTFMFAAADGWDSAEFDGGTGDAVDQDSYIYGAGYINPLDPALFVKDSDNLLMGKITFSPPGMGEGKQSDAHIGEGKHMTFGGHYALQKSIKVIDAVGGLVDDEEDRMTWGAEFSMHQGPLTIQYEYIYKKTESTNSAFERRSNGWYIQGGYLVPGSTVEVVGRYELNDLRDTQGGWDNEIRTIGLNWYGKGHSYKVGTNWVHTQFDKSSFELAAENEKDVFQVQAQYYF